MVYEDYTNEKVNILVSILSYKLCFIFWKIVYD